MLYLAYLLSEMPVIDHDSIESLPVEVLDSLKLDIHWMTAALLSRDRFIGVIPTLVYIFNQKDRAT